MLNMKNFPFHDILIVGGTGTYGQACTRYLLRHLPDVKIRIYSRDEVKQAQMKAAFGNDQIVFQLGDVRDPQRLQRACRGADLVILAAALKRVDSGESNVDEHVKTNILGGINTVEATINAHVKKVIFLSSDKACAPINLYGATKMVVEKLFIGANHYSQATEFSVVRYGNVMGSRGSVLEIFKECYQQGKKLPITHMSATRFWMDVNQAVELSLAAAMWAPRAFIYVPLLPSFIMSQLAGSIYDSSDMYDVSGLRPGEKLDETLLTQEELLRAAILSPMLTGASFPIFSVAPHGGNHGFKSDQLVSVAEDFKQMDYSSSRVDDMLSSEDIKNRLEMIGFLNRRSLCTSETSN